MYQIETAVQTVETKALPHGGEIEMATAEACHQNYLESKAEGFLTAAQCPEAVVFNLSQLKAFMERVEAVYEELQVPEANRGIAVMPMMYEKDGQMNLQFVPCVKDSEGKVVHSFNVITSGTEVPADLTWWDVLWRTIWNHGSGMY